MLVLTSQDSGMYQCSSAGEHQMRGSDGQTFLEQLSLKLKMPCAKEDYTSYSYSYYQETTHGYTNIDKSTPEQTKSKVKIQDSETENSSTDHDRILTKTEALELCCNLENHPGNLVLISDYVKEKRNAIIQLPVSKVTKDMYIRICGLDGTIYRGEKYMLKEWEELYLPKPTKMEVLGILESSKGMVPLPQWIVLVAEDGLVYGYEDEVLHLFATSLKKMIQDGIQDTGKSYDYPDDISEEKEEVLKKDEELQRRSQKIQKFIDQDADELNDFLTSF